MTRISAVLFLGCAVLGALATKDPAMAQGPRHSTPMPLPREGDVAIREELEAARRAGTREAYDLFLARHPQHPLAAAARQERDRLTAR